MLCGKGCEQRVNGVSIKFYRRTTFDLFPSLLFSAERPQSVGDRSKGFEHRMPPRDSASGAGNRHLGAGHEPGGTSAKLNIETREMDQLSKIKFSAKSEVG
jgi:hypothetical protein